MNDNWENEGGTVILENPYVRENNAREDARLQYEFQRHREALEELRKAETKANEKKQPSDVDART